MTQEHTLARCGSRQRTETASRVGRATRAASRIVVTAYIRLLTGRPGTLARKKRGSGRSGRRSEADTDRSDESCACAFFALRCANANACGLLGTPLQLYIAFVFALTAIRDWYKGVYCIATGIAIRIGTRRYTRKRHVGGICEEQRTRMQTTRMRRRRRRRRRRGEIRDIRDEGVKERRDMYTQQCGPTQQDVDVQPTRVRDARRCDVMRMRMPMRYARRCGC
ncbi:hypothetical protein C8Q77DRAFT_108025 [Trametes polyzona]|nr:hypothetical protein C8Q77DRAFT_108025 [Trametes polyzona]